MNTLRKSINYFVIIGSLLLISSCTTKKEALVMKISNAQGEVVETVTLDEFLNIYKKNNLHGDSISRESIEDYMDMFVKYKLKVEEAEALGMDTSRSFITELAGYRSQLAEQYLIDTAVTDSLIKEAYERMKYDIRASHILISLPKDPTPEDTLKAWKKAKEALKRVKSGEDFNAVAVEISDDPSARDIPGSANSPARKGNKGDLGYFTVFNMIYPFENAAYNTPVGEISNITRSVFGYHILKTTDKKPAMKRAFFHHIFLKHPFNGTAEDSIAVKQKINDIYQQYLSGKKTFDELARQYNEDNTAQNGGVLRWYNVNGLVPEFVEASYRMNVGDVSEPLPTLYGWHIIKLADKEDVGSFKEEFAGIKQRMTRDSRANISRKQAIANAKNDFGFKIYSKNLSPVKELLDSSVFNAQWKAEKALAMHKPVMKIGDTKYTQYELAQFIEKNQQRTGKGDIDFFFNERFQEFADKKVLAYKDNKLEDLFPNFKSLMKEYRDGILLFDLMNKKVWQKAVEDTAGLKAFYETKKEQYQWKERAKATLFFCQSKEIANNVQTMLNQGLDQDSIIKFANANTTLNLSTREGIYEKGDNDIVDMCWKTGISDIIESNKSFVIVDVHEIIPPGIKKLEEIRGLMITQYQDHLEQEWIKELREKYTVDIFYEPFVPMYQSENN